MYTSDSQHGLHPGLERLFQHFAAPGAGPRGRHGGAAHGQGFPGGPGGPWNWGRGGGPPWWGAARRAGRGDVRAAILALLTEQPMHGYQIIQELEDRTDGLWRPSAGSVYPTLQQLEDEGLVHGRTDEGDRKVFELTDAGRARAAAAEGPAPWEEVAGGAHAGPGSLRDLTFQVGAAIVQVARHGTPRQIDAAALLLKELRRGLYQLLADDDAPDDPAARPPVSMDK